jgi:hypothetical protein
MKTLAIAISLAALAGCAISPQEVVEHGTRFTGNIKGTPIEAARCVARNAEYTSGSVIATASEIDAGAAETIIRGTIELTTTLSVWRFRAADAGSTFEVWVSHTMLTGTESHVQDMRGKC